MIKKMDCVKYDAPQVEVIEVEVEKGFANSQLESPEDGGEIG
jgi:hypothetical protein